MHNNGDLSVKVKSHQSMWRKL